MYKPEIVIMHTLGGDKNEHENSAYLVYMAFERAMDQGVPVGKLWMKPKGWLLEDPAKVTGRGKPDIQIDTRKFIKTKYEALNKHVSQNGGFMKQTLPDEVTEEFITVLDNMK
jgi:LmbE family N-acetylglucosaminyl deacetylase